MNKSLRDAIFHYASNVSIYLPRGMDLLVLLDKYLEKYCLDEDDSGLEFFKNVRGLLLQNSVFVRTNTFELLVKRYKFRLDYANTFNVNQRIAIIDYIVAIDELNEYCVSNFELLNTITNEKDKNMRKRIATKRAFKFFKCILDAKLDDIEMFIYIPLIYWSLQSLVEYDHYDKAYSDFLIRKFVPYLQKHEICVGILESLLTLADETFSLTKGMSPDFESSSAFGSTSELKYTIESNFSLEKKHTVFSFETTNILGFLQNVAVPKFFIKKSDRELNLLLPVHLYKVYSYAKLIDVYIPGDNDLDSGTEEYGYGWDLPVVDSKLFDIYLKVDSLTEFFSEEGIYTFFLESMEALFLNDPSEAELSLYETAMDSCLDKLERSGLFSPKTSRDLTILRTELYKRQKEIILTKELIQQILY